MKPSILINLAVLILVAIMGYALVTYFESRTPRITKQPDTPIENLDTGMQTPDIQFTDTNGKTHDLGGFQGKVVILNFWASWCPPCIKEFPDLIRAAQSYTDDVVLIAVSSDLDKESMTAFLEKIDIEWEKPNIFITLDEGQSITKSTFQIFRLPETIIIDKQGKMRSKLIGADWQFEDLKEQIEKLL